MYTSLSHNATKIPLIYDILSLVSYSTLIH